jgi:8-oxo-dGTP pyrophosphatase MutT (NUDIX family)
MMMNEAARTPPPVTYPGARPAATVVLARPVSSGAGFEILLVKRHGKSGFMAGAHVFPGGRVDEADARFAPAIGERCAALLDGIDPAAASAFFVAALRETEEEASISLMKDGVPHVEALHPWSWWITPEAEPKRFDTRFFLAEVPAGTQAVVDEHEAVDHAWLTPRGALAAYEKGEIVLAPPTLATLEDLAPFTSLKDAAASVVHPIRPVCPKLITGLDGLILALPGDELHDVPEPAFPVRTRIVMTENGRFASAQRPARRGP